ncbi:MAG: proteasome assembly chaperone family protein [Methanobacteriota archaeon]|nr:MAG: proteasome assembly chaperone family protein [Euryarchaeota archaeon]
MEDILVVYKEKPDLTDPILIEGLPGVGNVGKLAAEHLVDQLKAEKFVDIYSKYFPPQVLVDDSGIVKLVNNEMYYVKRDGAKHDMIVLIGDYQGLTPDGQYELADRMLKMAQELGVKMIFTLGGYGLGKLVEKPRVLGAVSHEDLVPKMKELGVTFSKGEPGSGIVGASGLLLGLGKVYGMRSVCLMGETSGYFVDPKAAQAVLEVLSKVLEVELDFSDLEDKAEQIDLLTSKLKDTEPQQEPRKEDLGYIG